MGQTYYVTLEIRMREKEQNECITAVKNYINTKYPHLTDTFKTAATLKDILSILLAFNQNDYSYENDGIEIIRTESGFNGSYGWESVLDGCLIIIRNYSYYMKGSMYPDEGHYKYLKNGRYNSTSDLRTLSKAEKEKMMKGGE